MNKQSIIGRLNENYSSFISYMNGLTSEEYLFCYDKKWSAAQHLAHIVLCVTPLLHVFSLDKLMIEQRFGLSAKRESRSYEALLMEYLKKLKEGGKAPERYVPETIKEDNRVALNNTLTALIEDLNTKIENFTELELDTLLIPHPLLGNLTLREMLYNAIYHAKHHEQLTKLK